jgi:putative NADPH-quinone reductase
MKKTARNILVLNGHPDPQARGLCPALCDAYAQGAQEGGHTLRRLDVARLDFGFLHSQAEFEKGSAPAAIAAAQADLLWANHLVLVYPMWLGDMPAIMKAFFEQTLRPGFAFTNRPSGFPIRHLTGRSARIIVTMGMPTTVYRWFFFAHGLRNLKRNILGFTGFSPVRETLIGSVGTSARTVIERRLAEVRDLGRKAL